MIKSFLLLLTGVVPVREHVKVAINRLIGPQPYTDYYVSREGYYRGQKYPATAYQLKSTLNKNDHLVHRLTDKELQFFGVPFNAPRHQVLDKIGKPNFILDNAQQVRGHTIWFYRLKLGNYRTISQVHFVNDHMFYAQHLFKNAIFSEAPKLTRILTNKYLKGEELQVRNEVIQDPEGNRLSLNLDVIISMDYSTGNKRVLEWIDQQKVANHEELRSDKLLEVEALYESL